MASEVLAAQRAWPAVECHRPSASAHEEVGQDMKRTAAVIFMAVAALACAALVVALGSVLTEAMDAWWRLVR